MLRQLPLLLPGYRPGKPAVFRREQRRMSPASAPRQFRLVQDPFASLVRGMAGGFGKAARLAAYFCAFQRRSADASVSERRVLQAKRDGGGLLERAVQQMA